MKKLIVCIAHKESLCPVTPVTAVDSFEHYKNEVRAYLKGNSVNPISLNPGDYVLTCVEVTYDAKAPISSDVHVFELAPLLPEVK